MGLVVVLETENREPLESVEDPANVLAKVLPSPNEELWHCLGYIDWYGDTVFNYLQAPRFLREWRSITREFDDRETRRVVAGIERLAERLGESRHVYLRFVGD